MEALQFSSFEINHPIVRAGGRVSLQSLCVLPPRAFVVTQVPQAGVIRSWIAVNRCFRHIVLFSKQTIVSKKFEALAYIMEDGP